MADAQVWVAKYLASIHVEHLVKKYEGVFAINDLTFTVRDHSFLSILGPSGCGKSTTLRCIAGLEVPDEGEIIIGRQVVYSKSRRTFIPPHKRNLGYVFQSFALWPHLNVYDHIAYGLVERKWDKERIKQRVKEVLYLLGMEGLENRYVSQLSGGQQQRVALGRAIAYPSDALLLDEPLTSLDAKLRERMRIELRKIQRELGITTVLVTHDRSEALLMSDEVVILNQGIIEQIGTPESLYKNPKSAFVADFLGLVNPFSGKVTKKGDRFLVVSTENDLEVVVEARSEYKEGQSLSLFISPTDLEISSVQPKGEENVWPAEVTGGGFLGDTMEVELSVRGKAVVVKIPKPRNELAGKVYVRAPRDRWVVVPQ